MSTCVLVRVQLRVAPKLRGVKTVVNLVVHSLANSLRCAHTHMSARRSRQIPDTFPDAVINKTV